MQPINCGQIQKHSFALFLGIALSVLMMASNAKAGCPCDGDADGDGVVLIADVTLVLGCIGEEIAGVCADADINCDGVIDFADAASAERAFMNGGCGSCVSCACEGDLDGNGTIDAFEITIVAGCAGMSPVGACAGTDINCDGFVNTLDADTMVLLFGGTGPLVACQQTLCDADADSNGVVDAVDNTIVQGCIGKSLGTAGCGDADTNDDGVINQLDLDAVACVIAGGGFECCLCPCRGDLDGDGDIDSADLVAAAACLTTPVDPPCDVNCDQAINMSDVDAVTCMFQNQADCECCADCNRNGVPDPQEPTTTLTFDVTGTSTGNDWSWEIRGPSGQGFSYMVPEQGAIAVGMQGPLFAEALALSINQNACDSIVATHCPCQGDIDGNGSVDPTDVAAVLAALGHHPSGPFAGTDVNCDGAVDQADVTEVQGQFSGVVTACVSERNRFSITVPGSQGFEFGAGSAGTAPVLFLPVSGPISFNPVISLVVEEVVPTVSEWGLIATAMLLLAAGTAVIARQRRTRIA